MIWYPQEYGRALSQIVPAGTGHRQSRESGKHLSSVFNPFGLILPPDCIPFCSQAALGYPKSSILAIPHYLNTFLAFLFCFTLDSHAVCKDSEKPTDNQKNHKAGGEMGLVCINTCKTQ